MGLPPYWRRTATLCKIREITKSLKKGYGNDFWSFFGRPTTKVKKGSKKPFWRNRHDHMAQNRFQKSQRRVPKSFFEGAEKAQRGTAAEGGRSPLCWRPKAATAVPSDTTGWGSTRRIFWGQRCAKLRHALRSSVPAWVADTVSLGVLRLYANPAVGKRSAPHQTRAHRGRRNRLI